MSLLESDDFSYYGKGANMSPNAPPRYQEELPAAEPPKARVRSGEMNVDTQKMSGFSLRRKKDKDETKSHKKNKSLGKIQPPDSPKSRSGSSRKQQYAHLLENEPSSDEDNGEDEDDINSGAFVLSKGHQAREKRGSFKSTVVGGEGLPEPTPTSSINPIVADNLFGTSPVKGSGSGLHFPVTFTPPQQPLTTHHVTTPPDNLDLILSLSEPFVPDPISLVPPLPPPLPHKLIPPVSQATPANDDEWAVTEELYEKCTSQFSELCPTGGLLSGERARDFFLKSTLPVNELSKIWKLSDGDCDGSLTVDEFTVAMKLVLMRRKNFDIPSSLPHQLQVPPLTKPPTEPVRTFNFPPPPPPHAHKKRSQTTPTMVTTPITVIDPVPPESTRISPPPIPLLPPFISNTARSKTEPSIAISDAMVDKPHPLDTSTDIKLQNNITLEGVADILTASFMSEGDVPLLLDDTLPPPLSSDPSPYKEPAVSRLISLEGEESTGDEDDTSTLVGGEHPPVPRPRKRRSKLDEKGVASDLYRSQTVHERVTTAPPPRPPPYKKSVSPPPVEDPAHSVASPSPVPESDDRVPIIHPSRPSIPPKPDVKRYSKGNIVDDTNTTGSDRGHGRSTSWDLSKMLRDERDMKFHDDVPSAEPPMPPPRRRTDEDGCRSDDDDDGRRGSKIATPLQRSASTGSIASVGVPTIHTKSRTSSFESGVLLDTDGMELHRAGTLVARRPAPAPPPNKPKKPMYPPSFKKVIMDASRERSSSGDLEDSLQSAEVYQKKSKTELQKSIRRLKEENNMYISLNKELNKKLSELRQERCRLDTLLKSFSNTY